ncbi:MAG: hypothetical protein ABH836_07635 [Candidatus Omnitrophota bacterium]
MQKLITRKQNRLKNYNYALKGYYLPTAGRFCDGMFKKQGKYIWRI